MDLIPNLRLRNALYAAKMTHEALGKIAKIPPKYISEHISGKRNLEEHQKISIALALHVRIDKLFED